MVDARCAALERAARDLVDAVRAYDGHVQRLIALHQAADAAERLLDSRGEPADFAALPVLDLLEDVAFTAEQRDLLARVDALCDGLAAARAVARAARGRERERALRLVRELEDACRLARRLLEMVFARWPALPGASKGVER